MNQVNCLNEQVIESLAFFDSELFTDVQLSGIFSDSKYFADAIAKIPQDEIFKKYQQEKWHDSDFNLANFIGNYFEMPSDKEITLAQNEPCIHKHIEQLWQALEKPADTESLGSLLPLKAAYIVPGGRFREIYYWDSYFTVLGLIKSKRIKLAEAMLSNFVDLQSRYSCIPNGNRSYYLSRSQPPILGLLVELLLPYQKNKQTFLAKNIKAMEAEYNFWMRGKKHLIDAGLEVKTGSERVVKMPDGSFLNRYWDDETSPRPESYKEDIELSAKIEQGKQQAFYRNIRAACESGWDFSSRWLKEVNSLSSICTTRILPIDLNCLLYKQESLLASYYAILAESAVENGEQNKSSRYYRVLAKQRKKAITRYMWSEQEAFFMDYDLDKRSHSSVKSLAATLPLFVELATSEQAKKVSNVLEQQFLKVGGLQTTLQYSSQQWDAPNGWAPLQWFSAQGLINYQYHTLAEEVMRRWLKTIECYFSQTGKLMEKYNVCQQNIKAEGGEYDVQEGFGWTNGVYQAFYAKLSNSN